MQAAATTQNPPPSPIIQTPLSLIETLLQKLLETPRNKNLFSFLGGDLPTESSPRLAGSFDRSRKGSEGEKKEGKKGETGRKRRELETWFVQGGKGNFGFPIHQLTTNIKREK